MNKFKKLFTFILTSTLIIFFIINPTHTADANQSKIQLDEKLKSLNINSAVDEIHIYGNQELDNFITVDNTSNYTVEHGQNTTFSQKNLVTTLDDNINIYLTSDLEELTINTKHTDIKLYDVNIKKININNSNGETKIFDSQSKNIEIKEENGEIVLESKNNLENLKVDAKATDIKLFYISSDSINILGSDNKVILTDVFSSKILLDTQNSKFLGNLLTKGNTFNFVDSKETVKTTDHSIYLDKSKNEFSVESK